MVEMVDDVGVEVKGDCWVRFIFALLKFQIVDEMDGFIFDCNGC